MSKIRMSKIRLVLNFTRVSCNRALILALLLGIHGGSPGLAATSSNATSPLGINLAPVNYYTTENPFLDIMKTSPSWGTSLIGSGSDTGEEKYLNLDANGWPITLTTVNDPNPQKFNQVGVLIIANLAPPPALPVQYVVRYTGEGTIAYGLEASKVASLSSAGRDVITVANNYSGTIQLFITSTDPKHTGNYIRNIQVVPAAQESALLAGQVFNPNFLNLMKNFRVLRFMDWFSTNGSSQSSWATRPLPANMTWASTAGVPAEVAVQLANAVSADPWLNVPAMADDNFITQLATLVHNLLGSTQKVYVEYSNETWNSGFSQGSWITAQGQKTWSGLADGQEYNRNWFGMRTAQMCDIWKSVWGSNYGRVVCVLGAQAASTYTATDSLDCKAWSQAPCSAHNITAVAIAPYFGYGGVPTAWTSQPDGGLTLFFASLTTQNDPSIPVGGWEGQAISWVQSYGPALAKYNLPLVAYEGGQGFLSFPAGNSAPITQLYINANRDPRMQQIYSKYLQSWKAAGGQMFVHYNDIGTYTQYGEWGALESSNQTTTPLSSAPAKWQALQNFISSTPCWWTGCTGAIGASSTPIPMAPTGLKVQ